jgi:hypothetical protein
LPLFCYYNSLWLALRAVYPKQEWKSYNRFLFGNTVSENGGPKSQGLLWNMLKTLFPETPISFNYILPSEEKTILHDEKGLQRYEFDVSFTLFELRLQN